MFTDSLKTEIKELTKKYPTGKQKSALLPALHLVQEQGNNSLSVEQMDTVAELLSIEPIEVYEVASFYTMFNLKPVGNYVVEGCQTGPCMVQGSDNIIDYIKQKLNIEAGETSADGMFTLKPVECLGACGYAPMMQMGKFYKEHLTPEKIDKILEECRNNAN